MSDVVVVHLRCPVERTPRVVQVEGMFGMEPTAVSTFQHTAALTWPAEWQLGAIVGPSGSGKSSLARAAFGDAYCAGYEWPPQRSVLDAFPAKLPIKDLVQLLSSVGFSSPPAWLRPYHALSNGEQFRVSVARALADSRPLTVLDEFTSVVDRQVAQFSCAAVAKAVRRRQQRLVAVSCHYDILPWLTPDWVYDTATGVLSETRGLQRPAVDASLCAVDSKAWHLFHRHHYLSHDLNRSARCYLARVGQEPAVFTAVLPWPHAVRPGWREHRTVCLPDFQGLGLGNAVANRVAAAYVATGKPYYSTTAHPAMVRYRARSGLWSITRKPCLNPLPDRKATRVIPGMRRTICAGRLTAGFRYVGEPDYTAACALGIVR